MQTVVIVIHLLVVMALVGVVLLQRSEGGALGIGGGGGGGGGFMSARGAGNALTRITAGLAVAFFATSLSLSLIARYGDSPTDVLDRLPAGSQQQEGETGGEGILDELGGGEEQETAPTNGDDPESQVPTGQ